MSSSNKPTGSGEEKREQWAREWWDYFCKHQGFGSLWSSQGWGYNEILPRAKEIVNNTNPPPDIKGEQTALLIPIIDRDWSIKSVQFQGNVITYGALWCCLSSLALIDFSKQQVYSFSYNSLSTVKRNGDYIRLEMASDNKKIDFLFRVPRPSKNQPLFGFLFDVVKILSTESVSDRESIHQQTQRESSEYERKLYWADKFIEDFFTFFSQITGSSNNIKELKP